MPCKEWAEGLKALELNPKTVPNQAAVSNKLEKLTGWKIFNAEKEFLNSDGWFSALSKKTFPATTYIRKKHELDFTPFPDLFHEYFGHLPLMGDAQTARITKLFAKCYFATQEKFRAGVGRLWWHAMEWSFVIEDGKEKVFGAGLLAGKRDFEDALQKPKIKFSLQEAFHSSKILNTVQEKYFIHKSLDDLEGMLQDYLQCQLNGEMPFEIARNFDSIDEIDSFRNRGV